MSTSDSPIRTQATIVSEWTSKPAHQLNNVSICSTSKSIFYKHGMNLKLNIFLFVVIPPKRELTMGCAPNSFRQFYIQGKSTIKSHVIYLLFVVSTLWNREPIFIPRMISKVISNQEFLNLSSFMINNKCKKYVDYIKS